MNEVETFPLEGMSVSVEESPDALTYRFVPKERFKRPGLPLSVLLVAVVYPLGLLVLVVYARSKVANRPEWEDFLTGVFLGQLFAWLVVGTVQCSQSIFWLYRPYGTVLKFTRTHLWHGDNRVCELEQVRGLRMFVYPAAPASPKREAHLSLVIGEQGHTHGLFGAFDEPALRGLAEHIHRRLSAFRYNQGMMEPLAPLEVVETTEDEAAKLMHTRPAPDSFATWGVAGVQLVVENRWAGIAWCVTIFAGVFASGRMIGAAALGPSYLVGHGLLAFVHVALLMGHLGGRVPPKDQPDAK